MTLLAISAGYCGNSEHFSREISRNGLIIYIPKAVRDNLKRLKFIFSRFEMNLRKILTSENNRLYGIKRYGTMVDK